MSSALRKARTLLSHGARWRLAITIAAVLTLLLDVLESMRTARRYALGLDYHIYVSAARIGLERGWSHIYDRGLQSQFQLLLHPPAWPVVGGSAGPFHSADYYFLPFYNPPPQAWLMVPFTRLPYALSYLAWAALGLAALVAAMRWAIPEGARGRATIILAAVSPWVVMVGLHVGQGVVLVAAAVLLSWGLMRRGHDVPAGVVLAAMVLKPHPAILIPFALLACGRWRVFLGWAGAVGVLAAASIATVGLAGTQEYVRQLAATHPPSDDYLTLHGLLGPGGVTAALEVGVVAATLGCAWLSRRRRLEPVLVAGILGSLLALPYLHASDLCLLSVAGVIAWNDGQHAFTRAFLPLVWLAGHPLANGMFSKPPDARVWVPLQAAWLGAVIVLVLRSRSSPGLLPAPEIRFRAPAGRQRAAGTATRP